MRNQRRVLAAIVGVLAIAVAARGDMMPMSPSDIGYQQAPPACSQTDQQRTHLSSSFTDTSIGDPLAFFAETLPVANADVEPARQTQSLVITSDGQSSLALCLYALIGLGLCRSAPLVKKLHFGCIPTWYHSDGPLRIGHSFAVSPDCRCCAQVCFIQPDHTEQDHIPQYRLGTVVSLWRKSQFTPTALASRGPPNVS